MGDLILSELSYQSFSQPVPLRGGLRQGVTILSTHTVVGASVCVSLRGCVCVCVTSWVRLCVCHFVGASVCLSVCLSVSVYQCDCLSLYAIVTVCVCMPPC